jgi:hypothetical protein
MISTPSAIVRTVRFHQPGRWLDGQVTNEGRAARPLAADAAAGLGQRFHLNWGLRGTRTTDIG